MSETIAHGPLAAGSHVLREYVTYDDAQRLVDRLSDDGFPVEHVRIVGTGLRSVEQVTGRLTTGRAALGGAAAGGWFGLLIGLLLGLFTIGPAWLAVLFGSLVIGAFWGAVFGFVAHWTTRGRRDFSSVNGLQATRYSVEVGYVAEAARIATASDPETPGRGRNRGTGRSLAVVSAPPRETPIAPVP